MLRWLMVLVLTLVAASPGLSADWRSLYDEAGRLRCEANYASAAQAYRHLLNGPEGALLPPSVHALALAEWATCLLQPEDTSAADSCFQLAQSMSQVLEPPDSAIRANVMYQHAAWRMLSGQTAAADSSAKETLRFLRMFAGPDSLMTKTLMLLGQTASEYADYHQALACLKEALHYSLGLPAAQQRLTVACYISLGNLYQDLGKRHTAITFYRSALRLLEKSQPRSITEATCLTDLAAVLEMTDRFDEALQAYESAFAIYQEKLGPDDIQLSPILTNMAVLYRRRREFARADSLLVRVLNMDTTAYGADHPAVARDLDAMGENRMHTGDYEAALRYLDQSQQILRRRYGSHHPEVGAVWNSISSIHAAQGEWDQAIRWTRDAYELRRDLFRDEGRALDEGSALDFARQMQDDAGRYLSYLLNSGPLISRDWSEIARVVLSNKGLVSDIAFARRRAADELTDSTLAPYVRALNEASQKLANLYALGDEGYKPGVFDKKLAQARQRKEDADFELAKVSSEFSAEREIWDVTPADFTGRLPRKGLVIEYLRYDHYTGLDPAEARYLAVAVNGIGQVFVYPLGPAEPIENAVAAYMSHFREGILSPNDYAAVSADLVRLVWQPMAELTASADPILIAPDGALNLVSFCGLLTDSSRYLIEDHRISYLSAARDVLRPHPHRFDVSGLLAMGDPDYALTGDKRGIMDWFAGPSVAATGKSDSVSVTDRSGLGRTRLQPLPQTRQEIQRLVLSWQQHRTEPVDTFMGAQASEENFKLHAPGRRVIHLATHGFYAGSSEPILAEMDSLLATEDLAESDPLLNSGFYLAGASAPRSAKRAATTDDGLVSAEEVARMHLNGTELVVISACESGRGDIRAGEGVYGLQRAFHLAGVRTVISTLWPIPDASTAELIPRLYADTSSSFTEALRKAQLDYLTRQRRLKLKNQHPYYWAAFIAAGNGEIEDPDSSGTVR